MAEIPKNFLVFQKITKTVIQYILDEKDPQARKETLLNELDLEYEGILKDIMTDFHFNNLTFSIIHKFSAEKASCIFEILKYTLESSLTQRFSEIQSFEIFKKLLLKHSVQRSPYSIAVFTIEEVKKIIDFALITLFRHYSLYEYAFTPNCNLNLKNINRFEGQFPIVLKLVEGSEIMPETISALDEFVIKPVIEEPAKELGSEEEEALITDPLQYLLEKELKLIKAELDEKIKKQDDEFMSKIEALKK